MKHPVTIMGIGTLGVASAATVGATASGGRVATASPPGRGVVYGDPAAGGSPGLPLGGPLTDAEQDAFRKQFGLPTDAASIAAARRESADNPWGLPLTANEVADVRFQFAPDGSVREATTRLADAFPEAFAGLGIDHRPEGRSRRLLSAPLLRATSSTATFHLVRTSKAGRSLPRSRSCPRPRTRSFPKCRSAKTA